MSPTSTKDTRALEKQLRGLVGKPRPDRLTIKVGPGVEARVDTTGVVTFSLRYSVKGTTTQRRVHLGTYTGQLGDPNSMTPADALAVAHTLRSQARNATDVALEAQRAASGNNAPETVSDLCDRFLRDHKGALGANHEYAIRRDVENTIKVAKIGSIALGSVRIADVRKADLTALLRREFGRRVSEGLHAASSIASVRATLRSIFGYAEDNAWLPANPAAGLKSPPGAVLTERDRVLSPVELADLWRLLTSPGRGSNTPAKELKRAALLVIMLTGSRSSEVLNRRRKDFDLNAATMTIRDGKTTASNRTVPLSPVALQTINDILGGIPTQGDALLFPAIGKGKALTSRMLAKEVALIATALGHDKPDIWGAHDLRRSCVSWMEGSGVDTQVVRKLVGHVGQDVHSKVYDRSTRLEDQRAAVLAYERHVSGLAQPKGGNVISITKGTTA
jgi:integrase